ERLRNFKLRMEVSQFASGKNEATQKLASDTVTSLGAALAEDLNTAEFQGAIFEMVRQANAAADRGELKRDDVPPLLGAMQRFDDVFAVMQDCDPQRVKAIVQWAEQEGQAAKVSDEARKLAQSAAFTDEQIEALVAEHVAARKARNFQK